MFTTGYTAVIGDRDKAILHVEKIFDEVDFNRSGKVDFTGNQSINHILLI